MKNDTMTPLNNAAGEAAVWHVANEAGPVSAVPDAAMIADVRLVDGALRALAASESPDAIELRRMRDAAIRITRLHAIEAMNRGTLSPPTRLRTIPKWPFAAAAAAAIAVGFFAWLVNTAPSGGQRPIAFVQRGVDPTEDRRDDFRDYRREIQEYSPLVSAFTPVEFTTNNAADAATDSPDATPSALDDLDSQVDALAVLGGQGPDTGSPQ